MTDQISAEMLLCRLYPELEGKWTVRQRGSFFRNYSSDIIGLSTGEAMVELSRDGFLRQLPSGLLSPETELMDTDCQGKRNPKDFKGRYEEIKLRLQALQEAFLPVDSMLFGARLKREDRISQILSMKLTYILKEYFDYEIEKETDPLRRKVALLLPFYPDVKGDIHFIKALLGAISGHRVRMVRSLWSEVDNTRCALPKVRYEILADGLSREAFLLETRSLKPVSDFVRERLMPFDCIFEVAVRGKARNEKLLNYNITL